MTELAPEGVEVQSPLIAYNTSERDYEFTWFNTLIRLYGDHELDDVRYLDDGQTSHLLVPDGLHQELLDQQFPMSYFPTPEHETYWHNPRSKAPKPFYDHCETMTVNHADASHELRRDNTVMRIFGESNLNHIEVRIDGAVKGMFSDSVIWEHLFLNNYPLIYLPTVELDETTKQWFEGHKTGQTQGQDNQK